VNLSVASPHGRLTAVVARIESDPQGGSRSVEVYRETASPTTLLSSLHRFLGPAPSTA
jgi:hypothetical protein